MSDAARIQKFVPADLDEDQRELYAAIAGGPRAQGPQLFRLTDADGGLEGPFNAFLLQPSLGLPLQELGAAVRYRTTLSDRAREIAILVVATAHDSAFERYAHEAVGRHVGLTDTEVQALREDDLDALVSPTGRPSRRRPTRWSPAATSTTASTPLPSTRSGSRASSS